MSWSASARATRYELQENAGWTNWTDISTTFTGTSWTTPVARTNGVYYHQARACNVYGCSTYSSNVGQVSVDIPTTQPMTTPMGFSVTPGALNSPVLQPHKFRWNPVEGASFYELKQEDLTCSQAPDQVFSVAANEPQPYAGIYPELTMCNGQSRDPSKFLYSLRACNGSTCSNWTSTLMVTVSGTPLRPAGATTTYIHTDGLRSPVAETNATGAVTSRMRYEPYGAPMTGTQAQGPGYAGHVWDAVTGLSYMQQRYYDPIAGRFLSTDPIAENATSFNRYWYANNNPYKNIDPDGRETGAAYSAMYNYELGNYPQSMSAAEMGAIVDFIPVVGDIKGFVDAYNEPSFGNIAAAVVGLAGPIGDAAGKGLKTGSHILKNAEKGRAGEAATRAKLGDSIAGERVTFETSDGTRTRADFVTKDGGVVETKTGNATLSEGQRKLFNDTAAGRQVTPVGKNADKAGLPAGRPTTIKSCAIDRPGC